MLPKRQRALPFQRTVIQCATRSAATSADTPATQNTTPRLGIYTLEALECLKSWLKISTFLDDEEEDDGGLDDDIRGGGGHIKGGSGQLGSIEISD